MNIEKQIKKLYLFEFVNAINITDAVWVLFLLSRGYSLFEVGLAEGFFHIVSFICEVPSGFIADIFGRKRTMVAAGVAGAISALLMAASTGFIGICASMGFSALSYNLLSGTRQALTYDSLVMANKSEQYIKVSAVQNTIYRVMQALSSISSVVAVALGYMRAYLVSGLLALFSVIITLFIKEPIVTESQKYRQRSPLADLKSRLKKHINVSKDFLIHHPRTVCIMLADCSVACATYITFMLLQQHLVALGLPKAFIGTPLLIIQLAGAAGTALATRLKGHIFKIAICCAVGAGVGTVLAGSSILPLAVAGAVFANALDGAIDLQVGNILNQEFPSDQRATLVSVESMMYSLLMILVSPTVSFICNLQSVSVGISVLGIALVILTPVCGIIYKRGKVKFLV